MIQPSAETVAELNVTSLKSTKAVVPDSEIVAPLREAPPAL